MPTTTIILPDDSKFDELRKRLANLVKDPRRRKFEEMKAQGFDTETAMELSGLDQLPPDERFGAVIEHARLHQPYPGVGEVGTVAVQETNQALRSVGSAAGAAIGSTVGLTIYRFVFRHRAVLSVAGVAGAGVVLAVLTAKLVTGALGTKLAAVAAANVLSASGIVAIALAKVRK